MNELKAKKIFEEAQKKFEEFKYDEARNLWLKILEFYPENLSLLRNISLSYFNQKKFFETEKILKKILKINLSEPNAISMLIFVLEQQDKIVEAQNLIKEGLKNNILEEHWNFKMKTMIPMIRLNNEIIKNFRSEIENYIDEIINDKKNYNFNPNDHLIKPPHFGLSYDEFNNLELNKKCVNFFRKIYPGLNKSYKIDNHNSNKIKIGFISEYLTDHTIGKLFKGIILNLNKNEFDIKVFHTEQTKKGLILDELITAEKNESIKNYFLPKNFHEKQKIILKEKLDILFYPEIGLSLQLYYLSFLKLAKYQVTSWGHPETTGNHSIDYFISSKLIESSDGQNNYSEKLICSDSLPMFYYKPKVKKELNEVETSKTNIYSCPQTLFKLHPEFDKIIEGIQARDKNSIIYFIKDPNQILFKILIDRMKKNSQINLDKITFLEGLSWEEYINHCGKASVLLDPLYFGAGNSFYESMFYGTPTISLPTKYTKSRLVLGAYNQMDISNVNFNPISNSLDDYVSKAVETANKPNLFELKQELKSKAHKKLYENKDSIIDLEMIFKKIVS